MSVKYNERPRYKMIDMGYCNACQKRTHHQTGSVTVPANYDWMTYIQTTTLPATYIRCNREQCIKELDTVIGRYLQEILVVPVENYLMVEDAYSVKTDSIQVPKSKELSMYFGAFIFFRLSKSALASRGLKPNFYDTMDPTTIPDIESLIVAGVKVDDGTKQKDIFLMDLFRSEDFQMSLPCSKESAYYNRKQLSDSKDFFKIDYRGYNFSDGYKRLMEHIVYSVNVRMFAFKNLSKKEELK